MPDILNILLGFVWGGLYAFLAFAAFYRLGSTHAGLLIGCSSTILSIKVLLLTIVNTLRFAPALRLAPDHEYYRLFLLGSSLLSCFLFTLIAFGIILIPASLAKLGKEEE